MQQIKSLTKIVLALFFLTGLSNLQAQIFYVDQNHANASDSNPGTEALPWKTLLKATQTVAEGNTVYVKAGVYIDTVNTFSTKFTLTNSGTAANPITFISTPQLAAIIRSSSLPSSTNNYAWALGSGNQYITIDGFKIEGGLISYGDYNIIKNNEVTHGILDFGDPSLNWGITLYNASYSTVENNYVHSMIDSGNNGHNTASIMVFLDSDYNVIQRNTADAGNGIIYSAFGQKGGQMNNNTWRYNLALNATAGFLGMASTNGVYATEDNTYYQNISVNCNTAFKLNHKAYRFLIYNNTAVNCDKFLEASQNTNIDTQL
ncbi:MAG: hypothetical protein L3J52_09985, partial [Proteobacteria bacterium]|nr:hypothetical protein [Pseudomonadota bacterium]